MSWQSSEYTLFTRYADAGRKQFPELEPLDAAVPEDAAYVGPIYPLKEGQRHRQDRLGNSYATVGADNIALELQNECEAAGRVLYPVYVESDAVLTDGVETVIEWVLAFSRDCLGVPVEDCTLYFSGKRSIHVHTYRYVVGETDRKQLKALAETFADETGAKLDTGIYSRKRQFRLPGVNHEDTGDGKIEIQPDWSSGRIARAIGPSESDPVSPFTSGLSGHGRLTLPESGHDSPTTDVDPVLNRARTSPEFSPYAKAKRKDRSVAVVRVLGGAFARKAVRHGATLVPAHFYAAIGCDGQYTKHGHDAPLQLSETDYGKWDYTEGDVVVVIGGQSRNSRIFEIDELEAIELAEDYLHPEHGSRDAALSYLSERDYDVGATGPPRPDERRAVRPVADGGKTEAQRLKEQAETRGIETLDRVQMRSVAGRLMAIDGRDAAKEWFRRMFGSRYDPDITERELDSVQEQFPNL